MDFLRLPRNYGFIARLPENFQIEIIRKGNETSEGTWYLARIGGHELNIMSKVALSEGAFYDIKKKDAFTLELGNKSREKKNPSGDLDLLG